MSSFSIPSWVLRTSYRFLDFPFLLLLPFLPTFPSDSVESPSELEVGRAVLVPEESVRLSEDLCRLVLDRERFLLLGGFRSLSSEVVRRRWERLLLLRRVPPPSAADVSSGRLTVNPPSVVLSSLDVIFLSNLKKREGVSILADSPRRVQSAFLSSVFSWGCWHKELILLLSRGVDL